MHATRLIDKFPIITDQIEESELRVLLDRLERVLTKPVPGAIAEFGCYAGTSSLFIRRILDEYEDTREYHVYDSFAGLPEKDDLDQSPAGSQFVAGALAISKREFIMNFKKADLRLPIIHKGWFTELIPDDIPEQVAFAFLDGDYYQSIATSLRLIERSVGKGSVIIVDDYQSEALPGARKAVDEWLRSKNYALEVAHSLAVITVG